MEEGDGCNTGSPVGGEHTPTGTPRGAGRAGRVAEGLVLPRMPGNAGGGKEPWFESDTGRMKGVTTGESLTGSEKVRKLQTVLHAKAKEEPGRRPPSHLDCRAVSRCLSRRNAYRPERSAHDAVRRVHTGDDTITGAPRLGAKRAREACAFKGGGTRTTGQPPRLQIRQEQRLFDHGASARQRLGRVQCLAGILAEFGRRASR